MYQCKCLVESIAYGASLTEGRGSGTTPVSILRHTTSTTENPFIDS
jgi:hypothetical protein